MLIYFDSYYCQNLATIYCLFLSFFLILVNKMISKVTGGTRKFKQKLSKKEITNIRTQNKFDTFYSE